MTAVSPNSGPTAGGTSVTITGTNLTGATAVNFGAVAATNVNVVSGASITATVAGRRRRGRRDGDDGRWNERDRRGR